VTDPTVKNPKTKQLLFGSTKSFNIQSRYHCYPFKLVMAGETKEVVKEFKKDMKKLEEITKAPWDGFYPIKCVMNCDLSATHKLSHMGGAFRYKV
jgi:hypothetical protein